MNVGQIVNSAWTIPGLFHRREAEFLCALANRPGDKVELGCWMGRSTSIILQAQAGLAGALVSVDPFVAMPAGIERASAAKWRKNLTGLGLVPPLLLEMTSDAAAADWNRPLSFLFIDGDHGYQAVAADLKNWARHVVVGGVVALHDMFFPSIPGVAQAVGEWWAGARDSNEAPRWRLAGLAEYLIAFERIK